MMKLKTQADSDSKKEYTVATAPTMHGVGIYLKDSNGARLKKGAICEINNDGTLYLCREFVAVGFRCDKGGHIVVIKM